METKNKVDIIRGVLSIIFLTLFLILLCTILQPFAKAIAWGIIIVLTTWPLYRLFLHLLPTRPTFAALLTTFSLLAIQFLAIIPLAASLINEINQLTNTAQTNSSSQDFLTNLQVPDFLLSIPYVGELLKEKLSLLQSQSGAFMQLFQTYQSQLLALAQFTLKGIVSGTIIFVLSFIISFFLFINGAKLGAQIISISQKLGGERLLHLLEAARLTVRGAMYGVVATAIVQGILAGFSFWVAGTPIPFLLGFVSMFLSLIPFGTPFVYVPVSLYMLSTDHTGAAIFILIWGVAIVSTSDNFLRPLFISQVTSTPILLVFMSILGGIFSFGLVGIFIGPAVIAVGLALWRELVENHAKETIS